MRSANPKSIEALRWATMNENTVAPEAVMDESVGEYNPHLFPGTKSIAETTEAVERWACDVREYEQRPGKKLDEHVKIGVILALAPSQVLNHCHLNSKTLKGYMQVK